MSEQTLTALAAETDKYLAEADSLKYGDHRRLLSAAHSAGSHAQRLGDFRRYAEALTHQAWAYSNLNQYEQSLTRLLEVLALARTEGFLDIEARVLGIISFNFFRCGIRQEAMHLYKHQLALGELLQNSEIQAQALNDLAAVKLETDEMDTAIELLERALVLMPSDTHHGLDHSSVHLNLSIAYIGASRFEEALAHAQQVLAQVKDAPNLICDAYLCLAEICLGRNQLQAACAHVERARAFVTSIVPPFYSVNLEQVTAALLVHEGRHREAAQAWERIYEMALCRQELDFAVGALNHVKAIYEQIDDTAGLISAYKRLSEDIPRLQKRGDELRFTVLRMVFAMDKAALRTELRLTQQKKAILERLSHEFRTPLAIIQSATDCVERYGEQMTLEQRQERLQRITSQVEWMTLLLEDILTLLKSDENNSTSMKRAPFDLDELAQDAIHDLKHYGMSGIRVTIQTQTDVGIVYGARKALRTVLVHLLTNALKFSQDDVRLDLELEARVLVIRVADQGIGIRIDDQDEILKPLVRGSNLTDANGTGLGLAIVAKLVEQLCGTIELKSVEGNGTTMTVRIPVSWASEREGSVA